MLYWDDWRCCAMVMHPLGHPAINELLVYGDEIKREYPRRFSEDDYLDLLQWTQHQPGFEYVPLTILKQAVDSRMKLAHRNPVVEWLESQKWDGKARVDEMLVDYFGVAPRPYALEVSRVMALSIVKRIISPGCQQDYSPQLIQEQGCNKSKACRVLAIKDEFYTDGLHDLISRDSMMLSMGMIIIELGEHFAATKHDANTSKAAMTRRSHKFVQKYEKHATEVPRTENYISTSNDPESLADPTGNRRWMPVDVCETCAQIDTDGLAAALPQIYAEALARLRATPAENYWPSDEFQKQYMRKEQEERRIVHDWEIMFEDCMRRVDGFDGDVLLTQGVGISRDSLASFFSNCEQLEKHVPSTAWKPMMQSKGWGDKARAHRLIKDGSQIRRYSLKGWPDVLMGEVEWHPRLNENPGRWSFKPSWETLKGEDRIVALEEALEGDKFWRDRARVNMEELLEATRKEVREAQRKASGRG